MVLLLGVFIVCNCSKTENITYDVYFWSPSIETGQESSTLLIDGLEEGILTNSDVEVDCTVSNSILNQLIILQLSNGIHEIEVRNQAGELQHAGSLEIKSNRFSNSTGIPSAGTTGKLEVNCSNECLSVKITF